MGFERDPVATGEVTARPGSRVRPNRHAEQAAVLRLQQTVGNRGLRALLRAPPAKPSPRGEFPTLSGATVEGGLDAASWKQVFADAKKALAESKPDAAATLYTQLYQDLAKTAGANVIPDIPDSFPINRTKSDDTGFTPGLNLVLKAGGGTAGTTGWVDSAGKFNVPLGFSPGDKEPHIAIRLFSSSFTEDKLMSLATLRHEMLHARYLQKTLEEVRAWRNAGGTGSEGTFETWLDRHRKDLTDADVELIKADAKGAASSTEVMGYTEGFMTVFHLIDPPPAPGHPIFLELLGVLSTNTLWPWANAAAAVQKEAVRRLERYYCEVLDAGHRRAFDDWVAAQTKQAVDDAAALKAKPPDLGAVSKAKDHAKEHFKDFIDQLQKIPAKCSTRHGAATGGESGAPTSGETPAATAARHADLLKGGKPGDEALVVSELRRLGKDTLAKIDEAAAKLPKNAGAELRRKISFVLHGPGDAVVGRDDIVITGGDKKVDAQSVEGGTVTVTSNSDVTWNATFAQTVTSNLKNAVTFQYKGAGAKRSHWIQLISRQVFVTGSDGRETVLDKETTNASGIKYRLTPKGAPPILAVDRATISEPWYEHSSPSHRDSGSINVADLPTPHEDLFKEFLTGDKPAQKVRAMAHLTTYLVRDDTVLFRAATDVTWMWERSTKQGSGGPSYQVTGPVYVVNGKPVDALDKRDREALVHDFPDMGYLP